MTSVPHPAIEVRELSIAIRDEQGNERLMVSDISFRIAAGETLALVGESGCGKSLTAMSLLHLLPQPQVRLHSGEIILAGQAVHRLGKKQFRKLRSHRIGVIFQDPMTALNPVQPIGKQIDEVLRLHRPELARRARRDRTLELLKDVGLPAPEARLIAYPHQLSGGMRQRVMIAMALAAEPEVLIADEPTTALDVTIQAQILQLLKKLQDERGMAMLFITHDLALVSQLADRVAVMYAGKILEQNRAKALFQSPKHPYTRGLLAALPASATAPKTLLTAMPGQVPSIDAMPPGCRFANRCAYADDRCQQLPPIERDSAGGEVACHHWRRLND